MSTSRTINAGMPTGLLTLAVPRVTLGAAGTTITVSGLNLDADGEYFIRVVLKNNTAIGNDYKMWANGDTTAANYYYQAGNFIGAAANAGQGTDAYIGTLDASGSSVGGIRLCRDVDGKPRAVADLARGAASSIANQKLTWVRNNTANVTSLSFVAAQNMAAGSYVEVYKIGGPQEGTSFPASPSNGQRFRRTDLKLDCTYYTGIGWLTDQEYWFDNDLNNTAASGSDITIYPPVDPTYQAYLTRWVTVSRVASGNTASVGWTAAWVWANAAGVTTQVGTSVDTRTTPDANATYYTRSQNINVALDTLARTVYVVATKIGAAGNLYFKSTMYYRKIIT